MRISRHRIDLEGARIDNAVSINTGQIAGFRNALINGAMMVAQRGASFTSATTPANSDDTYLLDRWILLSDGNDIVDVDQSTDAPTNGLNSIGLVVETIDKKFGILQIIEQKNCIGLIGETVTLSFKAKLDGIPGNFDNVKAAIISWDGTADAVTSDIISAWGVEGTNPTLVANWTYENTPANLNAPAAWTSHSVSALIDTASAKNIGVFIWSDVTGTTLGDFFRITDVQLEIGSVATPFERRGIGVETALCMRYGFNPLFGSSTANLAIGIINPSSTTIFKGAIHLPVPMRAVPTLSVSSVSDFRLGYPGSIACSALSLDTGVTQFYIQLTGTTAGHTATQVYHLYRPGSTATIFLNAEL